MPVANINGFQLAYQDRGTGPVLILLHGFPLDGRMWEYQLDGLSDCARLIVPDHRGFGQSAPSSGEVAFSIETLADDVNALARHLKLDSFVLAGFSMGGYVALAYAKKYSKSLRGLILVDTKADGEAPEGKEARNKMIELAKKEGSAAVAEQMLPKLLAPDSLKHRPQLANEVREIGKSQSAATIATTVAAMRDRADQNATLASLDVPALVIVGENDAVTPVAAAEKMQKALRKAELAIIRGAGHTSPMEQPEQVNQAIRKFLQSIH